MNPLVHAHFDPATWTVSYVVYDHPGGHGAIIDPVLDYDPKSGRTSTTSADALRTFVQDKQLTIDWIIETHAHADHLSGAAYLRHQFGGKISIGRKISNVQLIFKEIFNLDSSFAIEGQQFDHLFSDGDTFKIGELTAEAIAVPGHTPADMAYRIGDCVFVGDTLFMPDVGTARCDFPGGDAATLYQSIQRLLSLPDDTRLYMCHDYPPAHRAPQWESTVAEQKRCNIHVRDGISEADFVAMRTTRDASLAMPTLLLPSIQVNIRAGQLPAPEENGTAYLKIPLNLL